MSRIDRLNELVAVLTNQVALTQYRLAIVENESEEVARSQMRICLITSLAMQEGVAPDELLDDELATIEHAMDKLIASLNLTRSLN